MQYYIYKTKSYGLIAGFPEAGNKRRKEMENNFDIAGFARFAKNASFIGFLSTAIGMAIFYVIDNSEIWPGIWFCINIFAIVIIFIACSKRFDYTKKGGVPEHLRQSDSRENPWISRLIGIVIVVIALIPTLFAFREPKVLNSLDLFKVHGLWGISLPITEIASADTISWKEMPSIALRTNGISLFGVNRGDFKTRDGENVRISVKSGGSPVIMITDKDGKAFYINRKKPNETRKIFVELLFSTKKMNVM
jgi:hypothetical protein